MADDPAQTGTATDLPAGGDRTFTQQELDRVVGERLARERDKYSGFDELKAKASKLDELEQSQRSDLDKLTGERDQFKGRAESAESRLLRFEVAAAKGLPPKWASRLSGSTKEELQADADELLKELGGPTATDFDSGARGSAEPTSNMNTLIRRGAGRG